MAYASPDLGEEVEKESWRWGEGDITSIQCKWIHQSGPITSRYKKDWRIYRELTSSVRCRSGAGSAGERRRRTRRGCDL